MVHGRVAGGWMIVGVWVASLIAGCGSRPEIRAEQLSDQAITSPNPFAPVSMIVHPLTRVDFDETTETGRIICHLELRDSWEDACKGVGRIRIDLLKPTLMAEVGEQALTWEVDLADLPTNARLYDQATRTYRLALDDAPAWLINPPSESRLSPGRLVATLTCPDVEGKSQRLRAEYVIER